jgi:MATE family multidrug resistance protein
VQCVSLGILRGINDTKMPTVFTVIAYWVIGIPIGWLLAKYFDLGLYGIWFGLSLGLTFSAIVLSIRFIKESNAFDFVKDEQQHFKELIN